MVFGLLVVTELTSSFTQRYHSLHCMQSTCVVSYLIMSQSLPPTEQRRPPSTPAYIFVGFIAPPNDKFWEVCQGFTLHLGIAAIAPKRGDQIKIEPFSPSLWIACDVICDYCWILELAMDKWSGSAPFLNSGRLIYLRFCFQSDLCESIAVRLIRI